MEPGGRKLNKFLSLLLGLIIILGGGRLAAETVMFSVSGGYLFPADSGYKEVYGRSFMVPEFKLGIKVIKDIYVYGNFLTFSRNGLTPELQEPASSNQSLIGGGLAYFPYLTSHWKLLVAAGLVSFTYKEKAMEIEVSGNKIGFSLEAGLYLKEKFLLFGLNAGYHSARDSYEGVDFKLGGARVSLSLGFVF